VTMVRVDDGNAARPGREGFLPLIAVRHATVRHRLMAQAPAACPSRPLSRRLSLKRRRPQLKRQRQIDTLCHCPARSQQAKAP
jgi:hypothetical protein